MLSLKSLEVVSTATKPSEQVLHGIVRRFHLKTLHRIDFAHPRRTRSSIVAKVDFSLEIHSTKSKTYSSSHYGHPNLYYQNNNIYPRQHTFDDEKDD